MPRIQLALAALCILAACDQTTTTPSDPGLPADDPRQAELFAGECAIYFAAAEKLMQDGVRVPGSLTRGCPADAARAVSIDPMVSVPPLMSGYPQTLNQKILSRGVPSDLAADIAKSKAFWDQVAKRDSLVAGF